MANETEILPKISRIKIGTPTTPNLTPRLDKYADRDTLDDAGLDTLPPHVELVSHSNPLAGFLPLRDFKKTPIAYDTMHPIYKGESPSQEPKWIKILSSKARQDLSSLASNHELAKNIETTQKLKNLYGVSGPDIGVHHKGNGADLQPGVDAVVVGDFDREFKPLGMHKPKEQVEIMHKMKPEDIGRTVLWRGLFGIGDGHSGNVGYKKIKGWFKDKYVPQSIDHEAGIHPKFNQSFGVNTNNGTFENYMRHQHASREIPKSLLNEFIQNEQKAGEHLVQHVNDTYENPADRREVLKAFDEHSRVLKKLNEMDNPTWQDYFNIREPVLKSQGVTRLSNKMDLSNLPMTNTTELERQTPDFMRNLPGDMSNTPAVRLTFSVKSFDTDVPKELNRLVQILNHVLRDKIDPQRIVLIDRDSALGKKYFHEPIPDTDVSTLGKIPGHSVGTVEDYKNGIIAVPSGIDPGIMAGLVLDSVCSKLARGDRIKEQRYRELLNFDKTIKLDTRKSKGISYNDFKTPMPQDVRENVEELVSNMPQAHRPFIKGLTVHYAHTGDEDLHKHLNDNNLGPISELLKESPDTRALATNTTTGRSNYLYINPEARSISHAVGHELGHLVLKNASKASKGIKDLFGVFTKLLGNSRKRPDDKSYNKAYKTPEQLAHEHHADWYSLLLRQKGNTEDNLNKLYKVLAPKYGEAAYAWYKMMQAITNHHLDKMIEDSVDANTAKS